MPPEPADPPPWMKKDETHLQEQLVNALLSHAAKEEEDEWMAAGSTDGGWWVDGIWWEKDAQVHTGVVSMAKCTLV